MALVNRTIFSAILLLNWYCFGDYDYTKDIELTNVEAKKWEKDASIPSPTYHEIMRYAPLAGEKVWRHLDAGVPNGNAHETMHGYFGNYGNHYEENSDRHSIEFFYLGNGKGALLPTVPGSKKQMEVPKHLIEYTSVYNARNSPLGESSMKYAEYFTNLKGSKARLNHVFEEWLCYITETKVTIELLQKNYKELGTDKCSDGNASFLLFASIAAYTAAQNYPGYFDGNKQFKAIFAALAEKAMGNYREGRSVAELSSKKLSHHLIQYLVHSPDMQHIRAFLKNLYDEEWFNRVIGEE